MMGPLSPCPQPQGRGAGQPQGFPHEHLHPPRHRRLHAGAGGAPAHGPAGLAPRGERRWSRRYGAGVRGCVGQEAAWSGAAPLGGFACPLPREAASSRPRSWGWRRCGSASPLLPCLCQKHRVPAQGPVTAENWAWGRPGAGQRQGPAWGAAPGLPPQPLCVWGRGDPQPLSPPRSPVLGPRRRQGAPAPRRWCDARAGTELL